MIRKLLAVVFAMLVLIAITVDYLVDIEKIDAFTSTSINDPALMSYQIEAIAEEIADHEMQIQELCEDLKTLVEEQTTLLEKELGNE